MRLLLERGADTQVTYKKARARATRARGAVQRARGVHGRFRAPA